MRAILLLSFLLILAFTQNNTNVTFQAPPAITPNTVFSFTNSSQDGRLIASNKLEALNLDAITVSGSNGSMTVTQVNLTIFNRSSSTQMKTVYTVDMPGNWVHVKSSAESLSCSVIYNSMSGVLSMLRWNRVIGDFRLLGALPLTTFTNDSLTAAQIGQVINVGENCAVLAYTNANTMQTSVYRANSDWTNIHLILLPAGFNLQSVSPDLMWAISGNKLYKYDESTFQYTELKTLPAFDYYTLKSERNRLIAWGTTSTMQQNYTTNFQLQTSLSVFAFHYNWNTGAVATIGTIDLTNVVEWSNHPSRSQIGVSTSPQLSKFGFGYSLDGQVTLVKAKHVDYNRNAWYDLQFSDPVRYFQTIQHIRPESELDFNDFYLVVRNNSNTNMTDAMTIVESYPVEQTWQILGSNFTLLRQRNLTKDTNTYGGSPVTRQLANFVKTFVDPSVTDKLIVLNLYQKDSSTYDLVEFQYGNIRTNNRIVKTEEPSYISFTEPSVATAMVHTLDIYQWAYFHPVGGDQNLTVFTVDNSTTTHFRTDEYTLTGNGWSMVYQNHECKIFANSASITVNRQINGTYESTADIFSLVGSSVTASSVWGASDDCSRIRVDGNFYYKDAANNNAWTAYTNPNGFTVDTTDANLTWALGTDGNLWKLVGNNLVKYHQPNTPFAPGSQIVSYRNIVGLAKTNASAAYFVGLADTGSNLNVCIDYANFNFLEEPTVYASPMLTKVLLYGNASPPAWMNTTATSMIIADFYIIDCPNFQNISLPLDHLANPARSKIYLGEEFIHITNVDGSQVPTRQTVYYFKQGKVALQVFSHPISIPANTVWQRSQIWRNQQNGINYLLGQFKWTDPQDSSNTKRVINATQVNGQQAVFNSQNDGAFTAQLVNGQVKLCQPGCSDCQCSSCLSGFALDSSGPSCRPCPSGCSECSLTTNLCTACKDGSFLNSSSLCAPCDPSCQTCSGTATSCTACPPGEVYANNQCNLCPKNCFECSDVNTCTACREGFTVSSTGQCRGCAITCAQCNPLNITQCTDCADGLFLDTNSQCVKCPDNCISCGNSTSCAICIDGYTPNSNGVCVLECQLPCLSCLDNQPTLCTSCPYSSTVSNNACVPTFACNADESCEDCSYGLNYYWALSSNGGGVCEQCPSIDNCIQCDEYNTYECAICANGYYIDDDGSCTACSSNCTACWSDDICTGCKPGWTLRKGQTEGRCRQCQSPCLTCEGNPKFCSSCISGFTKKGWKCKNDTFVEFTIVITAAVETIMNDIDNIVCMIMAVMTGQDPSTIGDTCDKSIVTLDSLASGSTVITGSTSTASSGASTTFGSSLGSYSVSSSSVTGYGGYATTTEQSSSSNTGMIVGIVVGVVALSTFLFYLVVITVIIVYCLKKRSGQKIGSQNNDNVVMINDTPERKKVMEDSGFEDFKKVQVPSNQVIDN